VQYVVRILAMVPIYASISWFGAPPLCGGPSLLTDRHYLSRWLDSACVVALRVNYTACRMQACDSSSCPYILTCCGTATKHL
jgi:hypothetical protein